MSENIVMSWSRCKIEVGETGANEAMATSLTDIGVINDKSTSLTSENGDSLTAKATGGVVVSYEEGEPIIKLTTRVKEMSFAVEALFTGATTSTDELVVKSNVVNKPFSVKLTPKNIGATGIKARKAHVSFKPGHSEDEGQYVDLTFTFLQCSDGEIYRKYTVKAADWSSQSSQ